MSAVPTFQNKTKFKCTDETVGLAEWIIDDTCLVGRSKTFYLMPGPGWCCCIITASIHRPFLSENDVFALSYILGKSAKNSLSVCSRRQKKKKRMQPRGVDANKRTVTTHIRENI